ncbi:craniofacial development protein 2-like [Procambarus clarkii]|uniref:craniofacial development protein 2-like n=1 Tax=Procambarus clarkii TaxID=6728 RepID=UPI003743D25B
MDIVTLQETCLPATGSIREKDFTFFWQDKPPEEVREHGVGFDIRNRLLGSIAPPTVGSARIIKLQLHTAAGMVSLINAYAPTLTSSTEAKDKFYEDLGLALREIPQQEPVFLLGDFNARVQEFTAALVNAPPVPPSNSASERWLHLRGTIFHTAMSTFGKRQNKAADWLEASAEELLPLVEEKRRALSSYKNLPLERTYEACTKGSNKQQALHKSGRLL